ncbi:acyl carrier protein [Dickeya fangzhongdai]|nr:acyl carrier protein [Dickeya fangzhongdai]KGT97633.1 acyl carrier protein [Dickeya fangzhongdai]KHN60589.1 acyl carrier protein [Dickeya fangzhongdai]
MMDKNEIYNEIKTLLVKLFELDEDDITLESRLYEDLELDSIDAVDMVVHLQKRIGRKISPETFKSVRTVQDVVNAIEQLMGHEGK